MIDENIYLKTDAAKSIVATSILDGDPPSTEPGRQTPLQVIAACDGACSGNGEAEAPGGWGVSIRAGSKAVKISGFKEGTTNNEMELVALQISLKFIAEKLRIFTDETRVREEVLERYKGSITECTEFSAAQTHRTFVPPQISDITIFSDSAYVVNCFEDRWYVGWEKNGWINSSKQKVKNRTLWERILKEYRALLSTGVKVHIRKIKGHLSASEARKWLEKYNERYGIRMSEGEFAKALELNREADELAVNAYRNKKGGKA